MPPILQIILRLLGGFGGGALASRQLPALASRLAPKLAPRIGGQAIGLGKFKTSLGSIGKGAAGIGGFLGGDIATGLALEGTGLGGEAPPEDSIEDIFSSLQQNQQHGADEAQAMQRLFSESEITNALAALGLDPDEVLSMAQPHRGIV